MTDTNKSLAGERTQFSQLAIGETFRFPRPTGFYALDDFGICTKLSARKYRYGNSVRTFVSKVGSISVEVERGAK